MRVAKIQKPNDENPAEIAVAKIQLLRHAVSGVSEILAPNNFGSALSKAALKGPLKGPLKAVIGRLQLSSWR